MQNGIWELGRTNLECQNVVKTRRVKLREELEQALQVKKGGLVYEDFKQGNGIEFVD